MPAIHHIESLDDPRVAPYRDLKDRDVARLGERFIAEGEPVVRRLLRSSYPAESVLAARRRLDRIVEAVPESVPIYVVDDELMQRVMGFKFHSGIIACGLRRPFGDLDQVMSRIGTSATIMACADIANTENLGSLMRIAAGFGVDAFVLGEHCCDPFYRQAVRVSMGTVFSLNLYRSADLRSDLERLRIRWGIESIAAVLDEDAQPLQQATRSNRVALLFGNEAQGLPRELVQACDRRVTIPMKLGTDSLNVAVAAGVFLYHFTMR